MDQEQVGVKTPEYVSLQFQLAGLGSRAAAFILDQLILMGIDILLIGIMVLVLFGLDDLNVAETASSVFVAVIMIIVFALNWGYFILFEYFSGGRTIGKRTLGIRVIQENGHSVTFLSSLIRNLLRIIDALPTGYLIGMLLVFFTQKHKRLGDIVAGTIVVHERKSKKNKKSPAEKVIANRGLQKETAVLDAAELRAFDERDWELISTYSNRFSQLPKEERTNLTGEVAGVLLPKAGMDPAGKSERELEDLLLILYLNLRDEWEYDL